jgi:hypothetical protein
MSGTGSTTPTTVASIVSGIATSVKAGLTGSVSTVVQELSADGLGLIGQEAEDFGNFVDTMVEDVETGKSWSAAWADASANFIAAEKSQLYQDAMSALQQVTNMFDTLVKTVEAAI